jgi:hypothetical protein
MIESLKLSMKTEISNRKETEEQLMEVVSKRTKQIETDHTLQYLN